MTASDSHVDDLIASFALDAVDDTERRLVQAHLEGCERCRAELREFSEAAAHLTDGREVDPPSTLRSSVLAAVAREPQDDEEESGPLEHDTSGAGEEPAEPASESAADSGAAEPRPESGEKGRRRGTKAWWSLAAAGLIAVGGWGIWESLDEDLSPTEEVIQADDAQRYETEYQGADVTVVASSALDRAVLVTDELPELEDDEVYQGWWIDSEGTITSAGVLEGAAGAPDAETTLRGHDRPVSNFAISVEPSGGSEQPSTDPVVMLPLED